MKKKFSDILTIINGRNQKDVEDENGEFPIYGSGGIIGYSKEALCPGDTCIIGRKGSINNPMYSKIPFWNVDTAFGLVANKEALKPEYLLYFCKNFDFSRLNTTVTIPSLTKANLLKIEIDLPDLETQQKRVNRLLLIDSLISDSRQIAEELDQMVKSRFIEMFGDPADNSKKWKTVKLKEIGNCKNGLNFNNSDHGFNTHCLGVGDFKDYTFFRNANLLPKVTTSKPIPPEYLLQNGDIVFVRSNGNKSLVGRSICVYPNDIPTSFSGFCIRLRITDDRILPEFLIHVLKTQSIRASIVGRGANIQNLNQTMINDIQIFLPSLSDQIIFIEFVSHIDKSKYCYLE